MENYEIVTTIGKGSSGLVYLAKSFKSKKMVAIKKVEIDESRRSRCKKYIVREASILRRLNHPHIVGCEEYILDKEEKSVHIVLEYCGGGTMQDIVKNAAARKIYHPEEKILRWIAQITSAVAYMHARRILHRDLKTENVFLIEPDKTKLGDFGISKEIDHTLDLAQTCVGTPCYLSPELCQDIPYNSKSDIWALGCLLFEITALKPAFDAANLISLFYKIVKGDYAPLPDHTPKEISDLVAIMLQKDPELRPTAGKLLQHPALVRFSNEPGISVKSTTVSLPKISPALQVSRTTPEDDKKRPPMLAAIRHRKVDSLENEELHDTQDTITNDTFVTTSTPTITEIPTMQFRKASENLRQRTQPAIQSRPTVDQRRRESAETPIKKIVEPLVLNDSPTEAECESARPQSCPHSVSRDVTENYEEDPSFTDTVVTWSGYGDRGSRHPSGRNNRRVSLSSDSGGSLTDSDREQDNCSKNSTREFNNFSTTSSSLDSDSDGIYEDLDDTATSNPTGDDEIPEEIVAFEDTEGYNSDRPKKGVIHGSGDNARFLPGSAWLRDKKIQVMETDSKINHGNKNDNNNNSKGKKVKKPRLPGSSWLSRKQRLSEGDRNHQESSSDEVVVLGEANENVQRRTKQKSKRKIDRTRNLPGSAWLKNTKTNSGNKSFETNKSQTRNGKETSDKLKLKTKEKSIILESCSSSANEYYDFNHDQMSDNASDDAKCYEYEDDFEISDDDTEDEVLNSKSSLDVVKKGCIDMLGEKTFEDLTSLFMRGLSLKEAANKFKSKNVNYETLETCFLLSSRK